MATSTSDMRLSGGDPALEFANSLDSRLGRWGPDFLRSYEDLLVLAERTGIVDDATAVALRKKAAANPKQADQAVKKAIQLREAIHDVFLAEEAGHPYPTASLHIIQRFAQEGRSREQLSRSPIEFAWSLPFNELEDVGRAFALSAVTLLIMRKERREVRECKGENCGWLFLDHSKGGRRMWCSEASCGTRSRIARFRAKPN